MLDIRPETTCLILLALLPLVRATLPALPAPRIAAPRIAGLLTARCASQSIVTQKELTPFERQIERAKKIMARTDWTGFDDARVTRLKAMAAATIQHADENEREAARTDQMIYDKFLSAFENHKRNFVPRPLFDDNTKASTMPLICRQSAVTLENGLSGVMNPIAEENRLKRKSSNLTLITIS